MPEHDRLISSQTSVNMGEGDSTKRALKVAGFTVLACALIAGQALTAYFLLSQKSQISTLQDNADSMKKEMTHRQSGGSSAGKVMRMPMSSMSMLINDDEKPKPKEPKSCLEQALEAGPSGTRPQCDPQGNFLPMQCQEKPRFCWCVKPDGQMILGSARSGKANCGGVPAGMVRMPVMSSVLVAENDE